MFVFQTGVGWINTQQTECTHSQSVDNTQSMVIAYSLDLREVTVYGYVIEIDL